MKEFILHLLALWFIAAVTAWPALGIAGLLAQTGLLGDCAKSDCAVTLMFVVFPVIWLGLILGCVALWAKWWRGRST